MSRSHWWSPHLDQPHSSTTHCQAFFPREELLRSWPHPQKRMSETSRSLTVGTFNVNGGVRDKLESVLLFASQQHIDLLVLQDTRLWCDSNLGEEESARRIAAKSGWQSHWSSKALSECPQDSTFRSRGIGLLYSSWLEPFVKKFQNRRRGDLASLDLQFSSGVVRILAVYAPNDPCPSLFHSIRKASQVAQLIMAGDFNRVLLPKKQRIVTEKLKKKLSEPKNQELSNLVSHFNLISALHQCSPQPLQSTYFSFSGKYQSQIDHILIKKSLSSDLLNCKVVSSPLLSESDHHLVFAQFNISAPHQKGNTLWLSGLSSFPIKFPGPVVEGSNPKAVTPF